MTIKAWHIDKDWQETFVAALGKRGASPQAVNHALEVVDDALTASGSTAQEEFGDPEEYAGKVSIADDPEAARASQTKAVLLALLGLVGMFLALWGFTALTRDVDRLIGMPPVLPLVVGLVVVVGAAVADSLLGQRADIYRARVGAAEAPGALAFVVNRLGPWIIVLLTLVGMLLIWIRYA